MNQENVIYTYSGVTASLKTERKFSISENRGRPRGHSTKRNKPDTEGKIPYNLTYMRK